MRRVMGVHIEGVPFFSSFFSNFSFSHSHSLSLSLFHSPPQLSDNSNKPRRKGAAFSRPRKSGVVRRRRSAAPDDDEEALPGGGGAKRGRKPGSGAGAGEDRDSNRPRKPIISCSSVFPPSLPAVQSLAFRFMPNIPVPASVSVPVVEGPEGSEGGEGGAAGAAGAAETKAAAEGVTEPPVFAGWVSAPPRPAPPIVVGSAAGTISYIMDLYHGVSKDKGKGKGKGKGKANDDDNDEDGDDDDAAAAMAVEAEAEADAEAEAAAAASAEMGVNADGSPSRGKATVF